MSIETERLIDEYHVSLQNVRRALRSARQRLKWNRRDEQAALDCQHLSSMERDLLWAIEYMETGIVPDDHRGTYRWTVPMDPHKLDRVVRVHTKDEPRSRWVALDRDLNALLKHLSPREKEALVLVRGQGMSFRRAAEYMDLRSSGTVSNLVRRAERKLRRRLDQYQKVTA